MKKRISDEERREKLRLKFPNATEAELNQKVYCQFPTPFELAKLIAETVREVCPDIRLT